jgi:GT2 family glycosyltransferase
LPLLLRKHTIVCMSFEPIPCIGIPYCNRLDLLLRCVRSIDEPVEVVLIIDQCVEPLTNLQRKELKAACAWPMRFSTHRNSGCAGAWNEIIRSMPAPYWLLVNNDIQFTPGDLAKLRDHLVAHPEHAAAYGNHGASWWGVTSKGVRDVGTFDENLWPAYYEDNDWFLRCNLLGLKHSQIFGGNARHGDAAQRGSCTLHANSAIREAISWCFKQNQEYYKLKWGGLCKQETFEHPFNDPAHPAWAWRFDPARRVRLASRASAACP